MKEEATTPQQEADSKAFEILDINHSTGDVVVKIKRGILGGVANQLKATAEKKGSSIMRRLGHDLGAAGDALYSDEPEKALEEHSELLGCLSLGD